MPLKVYNTLTRRREDFVPLNPPRVGMYVCGPTVYAHSHLGHAKSYVSFDVIVRWLRFSGFEVNYVQNITDVGHMTNNDEDAGEDPIIREARRRGLHPMAVVETFMRSFMDDMDALNLVRPDIMPRASGHIPEQIALTQKLIERGHAYVANGSVYFDVATDADYGKLSGRRIDEMEAGARVAVNTEKRNAADFALWKRADPEHIMRWPSPWGEGFPGWHIECSAMSQKYLGETFDIHGGGLENQFPHHECEIAQSECATGRPFVRYWLHNNMCTINGQKMGKSLGNAVSLKDMLYTDKPLYDREGRLLIERAFEPVVVRHFILTSHYRATLDFSNEALKAAESGSYKLRDAAAELSRAALAALRADADLAARRPGEPVQAALDAVRQRFAENMDEDFNTAGAIATLFDFARQTGEWLRGGASAADLLAADSLMKQLTADALGFRWKAARGADESQTNDLIRLLADLRLEARKNKNFALSDQIRDRLAALGVNLRDTPSGTTW
jgi:cysteinyl-tRNA synthetase